MLFLIALPLYLGGAPAWTWGALFAAVYVTGGWEPGWAGLQALWEKKLDVDLLMVVAALGAAAIGQVLDGALLIVIFAPSGALEALATARTADSVRGLLDLAPATATRPADDGSEESVPTEQLAVGDVVLVRPGEQVDAVALDKTGTLTEGTPRVTDIRPLADSRLSEKELLRLAAAAEHPSEHPLARAVVDAARARALDIPPVEDFDSAPGTGVTATVDGKTVAVGSPARLLDGRQPGPVAAVAGQLEGEGRTAVVVTLDGDPVGLLGIADRLRPDAAATVAALTALTGTAPLLVTGGQPACRRPPGRRGRRHGCARRSPAAGQGHRRAGAGTGRAEGPGGR